MSEKNFQEFAVIAAIILERAYSNFPVGSDIDFNNVAHSIGLTDLSAKLESGRVFSTVAGHTLKWLSDNGYVRAAGVLPKDRVSVTDKGIAALKAKSGSGISFSQEIEQATPTAGTNEGRQKLAEVIGSFFGSAAASFTKGLSGA